MDGWRKSVGKFVGFYAEKKLIDFDLTLFAGRGHG